MSRPVPATRAWFEAVETETPSTAGSSFTPAKLLGLLAVGVVVLALVWSNGPTRGSPSGTAVAFLERVCAGDLRGAQAWLDSTVEVALPEQTVPPLAVPEILVERTIVRDDAATVEATLVGRDERAAVTVQLRRYAASSWRVTGVDSVTRAAEPLSQSQLDGEALADELNRVFESAGSKLPIAAPP